MGSKLSRAAAHSENASGTDKNESITPTTFILPPGVWSECQQQPFRFLDLPPEIRNRIYDLAFEGAHGLSPHHLTQVNRQIEDESLRMFLAKTHTLQIPLQTAKQMTCFLKWIENGYTDLSPGCIIHEFVYDDNDVGVTTISFEQELYDPAKLCEGYMQDDPTMAWDWAVLLTWLYMSGLPLQLYLNDFPTDGFERLINVSEPTSEFRDAVNKREPWIVHSMSFTSEREMPQSVTGNTLEALVYFFFDLMFTTSGKAWHMKDLQDIGHFLFVRSMQARAKAGRAVYT